MMVLAIAVFYSIAISASASQTSQTFAFLQKQEKALLKADELMKTCHPQGIALSKNGIAYSHVADARARMEWKNSSESKACIKRIILQNEMEEILVVCE